jgi:hypothetical protein
MTPQCAAAVTPVDAAGSGRALCRSASQRIRPAVAVGFSLARAARPLIVAGIVCEDLESLRT